MVEKPSDFKDRLVQSHGQEDFSTIKHAGRLKGLAGRVVSILVKLGYKSQEGQIIAKRSGPLATFAQNLANKIVNKKMPAQETPASKLALAKPLDFTFKDVLVEKEPLNQEQKTTLRQLAEAASTQAVLNKVLNLTGKTGSELLTKRKDLIAIDRQYRERLDVLEALSQQLTKDSPEFKSLEQEYQSLMYELEMTDEEIALIDTKLDKMAASRKPVASLNEKREQLLAMRTDLQELLQESPTKELKEEFRKKLIANREELLQIEEKLTYMRPPASSEKVEVKTLSGGRNLTEQVSEDTTAIGIKKTLPHYIMQKAFQIEAVGVLSSFLPEANVVAARRKDDEVATKHIEGLETGSKTIAALQRNSDVTQHTALAALSFQMWDLHTQNIGIDSKKNLVIFDTDLALFEDNDFVRLEGKLQSPLGHNKLQDMDIEISDNVLQAHIEQLSSAIRGQFLGMAHGFTRREIDLIQKHLINNCADIPELRVYDNRYFGRNDMGSANNVDKVKKQFLNLMADETNRKAILQLLRNENISEEKIAFLEKHPGILHPDKLSFKQLAVLVERRDHLIGFTELRKGILQPDKSDEEKKQLIRKNIDHLPLSSNEKLELWGMLSIADPEDVKGFILYVQSLVGNDKIKWNTLARAMYPTLAALHRIAAKNAQAEGRNDYQFSDELSWGRKDYDNKVLIPLEDERRERARFLDATAGELDFS